MSIHPDLFDVTGFSFRQAGDLDLLIAGIPCADEIFHDALKDDFFF